MWGVVRPAGGPVTAEVWRQDRNGKGSFRRLKTVRTDRRGYLLADGLHNFIGGLAIGASFIVSTEVGVIIGMAIVFFYAVLGGMKGITWTQVAQYSVLIIAYLIPAFAVSAPAGTWASTGLPSSVMMTSPSSIPAL